MNTKISEGLKKYYSSVDRSIIVEKGRKILATKNNKDGKIKSKLAYEKCKDTIVAKLKGKKAWNKLEDKDKIKIVCLNCKKEILVVPSLAKTRKFCSRLCYNSYKKGRPMENWNPNSFNDRSGRGISGKYKGILFRSSLELSFVKKSFELGNNAKSEPFKIKYYDYFTEIEKNIYSFIKPNQTYTPDYIVNNSIVVELKPEKLCSMKYLHDNPILTAKLIVLDKFCKKNSLESFLLTDEDMGENVLTEKQIKEINSEDIEFFKEKHNEKFK